MLEHSVAPISSPSVQSSREWEQRLEERLPLFGHRNWIVVADSAYPAQSRAGIETISANQDQQTIVASTLKMILASTHVRPVVHIDKELSDVAESDAPGVTEYRDWLSRLLGQVEVQSWPHEEMIAKLDKAAETFNILIIKSTMRIPYTSLFFELGCAYWDIESEKRLRAAMLG